MTDQPPSERYKADMPQIPGVVGPSPNRPSGGVPAPVKIIGGLVAVLLVVVLAGSLISRARRNAAPAPDALAQVDVPAPDLGNPPPQSAPAIRGIATTADLAKAWSTVQFEFRNVLTGERTPAQILRLPTGSPSQPSGYWAFGLKAPYGNCQLEFVDDLEKLKTEYGFHAAKHPMVGNPCSHTLFDPLKMASLPGSVWVRGGIAQGSDLRPPLGIEIKIEGKDIMAVRME